MSDHRAFPKRLRDSYTATNHAIIGYIMLQTTGVALSDTATATLAEKHLQDSIKNAQAIANVMPSIVVKDLSDDVGPVAPGAASDVTGNQIGRFSVSLKRHSSAKAYNNALAELRGRCYMVHFVRYACALPSLACGSSNVIPLVPSRKLFQRSVNRSRVSFPERGAISKPANAPSTKERNIVRNVFIVSLAPQSLYTTRSILFLVRRHPHHLLSSQNNALLERWSESFNRTVSPVFADVSVMMMSVSSSRCDDARPSSLTPIASAVMVESSSVESSTRLVTRARQQN